MNTPSAARQATRRRSLMPYRRRHILPLLALGLAVLAAPAARSQTAAPKWPAKTVRIVVAGPSGGSADIVARLFADQLAKQTGQSVIVDPKPGAGGVLAVNDLSMAPRDGHTLLVGVNSLVSEIPHILKLPIVMADEVKPLAELARGALVMVGNLSLPAKTLPELVGYVKAHPGQVNFASYTTGTISHVMGLQLNKAAGIDMTHVGYKGSTPALQDLMGGHVQLMFDGMATSLPLIKAGRIRAYAVSTPKRSPLLPEVPTFAELGYPQLEAVGWMGLWAKPDLPAALQAQIREAALKALAQAGARERLHDVGFEPGQGRTPDELGASLKADYERVGAVLRAIGFKPE